LHALLAPAGRDRSGRIASRHSIGRETPCRRPAARDRPLGRAPSGSPPMTAPNQLSAAQAVAQLASGALTAEALTRACLDRAEERQSVKAWIWLDPDQALAQARAADANTRAGRPGLLAGLPVGVKDIIDTVDMPTEHGSPIYRGNRPFADAACIALLRMAGAVILGKTVTTEFANRFPGATVNPHNPGHTPGGSSSGSAAAVADFQVPVALGTQ